MYWFDLLELFKNNDHLSTYDIISELEKKEKINVLNVRKVLRKMVYEGILTAELRKDNYVHYYVFSKKDSKNI